MRIFWNGGANFEDVILRDDSVRYRKIMGENELTLKFKRDSFFEFPLGSYCVHENVTYYLYSPATLNKKSSLEFDYELKMTSNASIMANFKIKDTSGRLKFPFTGKPIDALTLLVNNLNANDSGWSVGNYIDSVEKLISFNHTNCLEALQNISTTFDTEWEIVNKVIHLEKVEYNKVSPLDLSYGKGNGFISGVKRLNEKTGFNVLYVQGGDRNIDLGTYGNKTLIMPSSMTYTYDGVVYVVSADGLSISIQGADLSARIEESLDLTNIYPKRTGTVSTVIVVDAGKSFYDFTDASIPADLDYSQYLLDGETLTVLFESGMLSGREFDVSYVHAEKKIVIVPQEYDGVIMPSAGFLPVIGDKYSVYGMTLPTAYIRDDGTFTGASWDLVKEACRYFSENSNSSFTFKGTLDGIWAKTDWINIGGKIIVGGYVSFTDTQFQASPILIRIVGVKDYLNNPYMPEIELANSVQGVSVLSELGQSVAEEEVIVADVRKSSFDFTKRRYRDAIETIGLLEGAMLEGFDASINPLSVRTMAITLGDESLQFDFYVNAFDVEDFDYGYLENQKQFFFNGQNLMHYTLGDKVQIGIVPSASRDYKTWVVEPYNSAVLTDGTIPYYVYVKASKTTTSADIELSATGKNHTGTHYYFLVGTLSSEYLGDRSFVRLYGFTEILAGQMKLNQISSGDGLSWIKLLSDGIDINAKVTFTNDSPALIAQQEAIETAVGEIQLGGENLLRDTNLMPNQANTFDNSYIAYSSKKMITFFNSSGALQPIYFKAMVLAPKEIYYTVSFYAMALSGSPVLEVFFSGTLASVSSFSSTGEIGVAPHHNCKVTLTSGMERHWVTFKETGTSTSAKQIIIMSTGVSSYLTISGIKLEEGKIASGGWSPASADVQVDIVTQQQYTDAQITLKTAKTDFISETVVDGNYVGTGTLAVGNAGGPNAFVSGEEIGGTGVRFVAGSNWAGRNTAPFRVLDNGSLFATLGEIAGWIISENEISNGNFRLNADRNALEIYNSLGKLAVDISTGETLAPLTAGTITASTSLTTSITTSLVSASDISAWVSQSTPLIHTGSITFSGTGNVGATATLNFNLLQLVGSPYFSASATQTIDSAASSWRIGLEITDPNGTKTKVSHVEFQSNLNSRYDTIALQKSITLIAGTYTCKPYIELAQASADMLAVGQVTMNLRTPRISGFAVTTDNNKSEMISGGFQVIKTTAKYLRADKNKSDADDANAWLTSGGFWHHYGTFTQTSDRRTKFNIEPLKVDLKAFKKIKAYRYNQIMNPMHLIKDSKQEELDFEESIGVMAQDVQKVCPEAVVENDGALGLEMTRVNGMLFSVVQQLITKVEKLEREIVKLKKGNNGNHKNN